MCLAAAVRGWQGHRFPLRVGAPPAAQVAPVPVQLGIFLSGLTYAIFLAGLCGFPFLSIWIVALLAVPSCDGVGTPAC